MVKKENKFDAEITFQQLSENNWRLFEELMGEKGGCGGCWCMSFRLSSREFTAHKHEGNKQLMHKIVAEGRPTGLMAVAGKQAIGWIALAPREDYIKIENSRTLKRIDSKPVWSITCFFIKKEFRKMGLSEIMINAAIEYAKENNIQTLEAYPVIPYNHEVPSAFLWIGVLSAFIKNGFTVVQRNGKSKAIVRLDI
jgi:GNAT superfamily N-acetyltransferase